MSATLELSTERPAARLVPPAVRRQRLRFGRLDIGIFLALALATFYVVHRVNRVLVYHWDWSVIPIYILHRDAAGRLEAGLLLTGLFITVKVAVWSLLLGILVGIVAGSMRVAPRPVLRWLARVYVELIRNSPPIVFIFVFYFFLSSQITPLLGIGDATGRLSGLPRLVVTVLAAPPDQLDSFLSGVLCLGLFSGAYITEIMRAGIASVGITQIEAARALGLRRGAVFRKVVLPQALQRMLPALGGQFIISIKDSAFVSLISIPDLTFATSEVSDTTHRFFELWLFAALLYFVVCFSCALAFRRLEYRARERRA